MGFPYPGGGWEPVPNTLGVVAPPGYYYSSAHGRWDYKPGGPTARIWRAKFHGWGLVNGQDGAYTGLFSTVNGNWEFNNYGTAQLWMQGGNFLEWAPLYCPLPAAQPTLQNPDPGCIDWGGTEGNVAMQGLWMTWTGNRGGLHQHAFTRGFEVHVADWTNPGINQATTPSWVADEQVAISAGDSGLGVRTVLIYAPNQPDWTGRIEHTFTCDGTSYQACPQEYTFGAANKIPIHLGNLPKGRNHTLRVAVYDAVGNVLTRDIPVGVAAPATDYALYREDGSDMVWLMMSGLKHWITSPEAAAAGGLDLGALQQVPQGNLASYPRGADISVGNIPSWLYPTSVAYGGPDRAINTPGEASLVAQALSSEDDDAAFSALWAGLRPADASYMDQYYGSTASDPAAGDGVGGRWVTHAASDAGFPAEPNVGNTTHLGSCFSNPRKNGSLPVDLPSWAPGVGTVTWAHHKTVTEHKGRATTLTADNGKAAYLIMADIEMKSWVRSRARNTIIDIRTDTRVVVGGNVRSNSDRANAWVRDKSRPKKMLWYAHKGLWVYSGANFYWQGETKWEPIDLVGNSAGLKWYGDFVGQNDLDPSKQWLACRA